MKIYVWQPTEGEQDLHIDAEVRSPFRGKKCVQRSKSIENVATSRRVPWGHVRCFVASDISGDIDTT